jgi:hypothetical protein
VLPLATTETAERSACVGAFDERGGPLPSSIHVAVYPECVSAMLARGSVVC